VARDIWSGRSTSKAFGMTNPSTAVLYKTDFKILRRTSVIYARIIYIYINAEIYQRLSIYIYIYIYIYLSIYIYISISAFIPLGEGGGVGGEELQSSSKSKLKKNRDFIDKMMSNVLHFLPFSLNQPWKSADD
jgi:hypothetical protein